MVLQVVSAEFQNAILTTLPEAQVKTKLTVIAQVNAPFLNISELLVLDKAGHAMNVRQISRSAFTLKNEIMRIYSSP